MQPLHGIRVLDLTHVFAGPFCAYQLAVMGAEVIKIEPVDAPDMTRKTGADATLNDQGMGLAFQAQASGKRALALDLKSDQGRAAFDRLVQSADVLVQNYATPCLADLGLEPDRLMQLNPRLIYCSICGIGRTGPKADHPAYDNVIQAFSGLLAANGEPGRAPVRIGPPVVDYGTGAQAALSIMGALLGRERSGEGRVIDVAMTDAALMLMTSHTVMTAQTGQVPRPHGSTDPDMPCYGAYDTAEGQVMLGAYTPKQAAILMQVLGNDQAAKELQQTDIRDLPQREAKDRAFLSKVMKTRTAADWEDLLNAHHVPVARVRQLDEALAEPQIAARQVLQDQPGLGRWPVAAYGYDQGGPALGAPAPQHGEHSRAVLADVGFSADEITALIKDGVVGGA